MQPEPLAMFPLATVMFPHSELPLHVFEPRYQVLTRDVLFGSREFGICLISRGSEVGGGDERVSVATRVRVEHAAPLREDRWILVTRGVERIRVTSWLDDDPYPRALVEPMPVCNPATSPDEVHDALAAVRSLRRLQSAVADSWSSPCLDVQLEDAPSTAPWMLCAMSPLCLMDLQGLLEVPDHRDRLALLRSLCAAKSEELEALGRLDSTT